MVGEVFGCTNIDVGIWNFRIGILIIHAFVAKSKQLLLVYSSNSPFEKVWVCVFSYKLTVKSLHFFLVYVSIQKSTPDDCLSCLFFFLDEKETKNQDLGFSAIKIGSLPKTQKKRDK
jgi:hypothetical protein